MYHKLLVLFLLWVCGWGFSAAAMAEITEVLDRRVAIKNMSSQTITRLYASNVDKGSWGRNILGQGIIGPHQYRIFNFDDGWGYCMFDFKAIVSSGQMIIRERVNVCTAEVWTIYDE